MGHSYKQFLECALVFVHVEYLRAVRVHADKLSYHATFNLFVLVDAAALVTRVNAPHENIVLYWPVWVLRNPTGYRFFVELVGRLVHELREVYLLSVRALEKRAE